MTYKGLLRYLLEKHPNMRKCQLPFEGCNTVLYMLPQDYSVDLKSDQLCTECEQVME